MSWVASLSGRPQLDRGDRAHDEGVDLADEPPLLIGALHAYGIVPDRRDPDPQALGARGVQANPTEGVRHTCLSVVGEERSQTHRLERRVEQRGVQAEALAGRQGTLVQRDFGVDVAPVLTA
ncbi:hypothetical protein GCM10020254_15310 [Streptomyces goshikiensis]